MTLRTSYLGLTLAHPFMLGASPLTAQMDNIRRVEDGGCAAIVMHSLFQEQLGGRESTHFAALRRAVPELSASFPHFAHIDSGPPGPQEYLEQIRKIKAAVSIPVVASLNGFGSNGWLSIAPLIQDAGADALELNVYDLPIDPEVMAADVENRIDDLARSAKRLVQIPVAVKLTPFYTAFGNLATRLDTVGVDGLVLFNRFYHSDINVDTLEVVSNLRLSTSTDLLLRLHWLAVLSGRLRASLAATGGVHTALDGIKALLSGAHVVQVVSAVLQQGPKHFRTLQDGLQYWMTRHQFESVDAFRGRANVATCVAPSESERTNYRRVLQTWGS